MSHRVVAVIGARGAGKTHFIAVLINELRKNAKEFMDAILSSQGDDTRKLYDQFYYKPLYHDLKILPPTDRAAKNLLVRKPLLYQLAFKRRLSWLPFVIWNDAVNLVFFDAAGEDITDERTLELHCRYVWNASALIFLFDPLSFDGVYHKLSPRARASTQREGGSAMDNVDRMVNLLEKHGGLAPGQPVRIPVAFTLTKLDALAPAHRSVGVAPPADDPQLLIEPDSPILQPTTHGGGVDLEEFSRVSDEVRSHINAWQSGLLDHLEAQFKNPGFFAVSSLGSPPEGVRAPAPAPVRVEDPLLWILWKLGYARSRPNPKKRLRRRLSRLFASDGRVAEWPSRSSKHATDSSGTHSGGESS